MSVTSPPTIPPQLAPVVVKRAPRPRRSLEGILVRRSAKAPGAAQYHMHELELTAEIPLDEMTDSRLKALLERWEPHFTTFEAKYVRPQVSPQKPTPTPVAKPLFDPSNYDIDWQPNKFGPGDYAFANEPACQDLLRVLMDAKMPLSFGPYTYSLNAAKTYIYRKKTTPTTP